VSNLPVYLDSSAIVKLVVPEAETEALVNELERWPDRVSAALAHVEVHRALRRTRQPRSAHARADAVLATIGLIRLDPPVLSRAAQFASPEMRSLDAIHVAAALTIGDDPEAFITYDARQAKAAAAEGLNVLQPGQRKGG
jgi:predicted nucleic acid-binding protein